jgi:hypothetical protein
MVYVKRYRVSSPLQAVGALLAVFLIASCGVRAQRPPGTGVASHARLTSHLQAVILFPDGVKFAPPRADAVPRMTAGQVYASFSRALGAPRDKWGIPANTTVQLGLFTLPVGPGINGKQVYRERNVLAYGYSWQACYASSVRNAKPKSPKTCREWIFSNANTGAMIVQTFQS